MGLNFGQSLFPPRGNIVKTFSFSDLLSGNAFLTLNGGLMNVSDEVAESYTAGEDGTTVTVGSTNNNRVAQTFTIGNTGKDQDFYVTKIVVKSNATVNMHLTIEETSGGAPVNEGGTVLMKWENISVPNRGKETISLQQFDISNATNIITQKLSAGTTYAFILNYSPGAGTTTWRADTSSSAYTGGALYESTDNGDTWVEQTDEDLIFWVYGSTTNPYTLSTLTFKSIKNSTTMDPNAISLPLVAIGNLDFSAAVNITGILKGKAIVEMTVSDTDADDHMITTTILHVRNSVITQIGTAESEINPTTNTVLVNLTTTSIAQGDEIILRITPNYSDSENDAKVTINHNPGTTDLKLHLPFKVDI